MRLPERKPPMTSNTSTPYVLPYAAAIAVSDLTSNPALAGYAKGRRRGVELAHMDYQAYLRTPEWQATRRLALDRAAGLCEHCGSPTALEVHHLTYDRRGCERAEDLAAICDHCHETVHGLSVIAQLSDRLGLERITKTVDMIPVDRPALVVDLAARAALEELATACGRCDHGWFTAEDGTSGRCECQDAAS